MRQIRTLRSVGKADAHDTLERTLVNERLARATIGRDQRKVGRQQDDATYGIGVRIRTAQKNRLYNSIGRGAARGIKV